jgi:hypothetical protein
VNVGEAKPGVFVGEGVSGVTSTVGVTPTARDGVGAIVRGVDDGVIAVALGVGVVLAVGDDVGEACATAMAVAVRVAVGDKLTTAARVGVRVGTIGSGVRVAGTRAGWCGVGQARAMRTAPAPIKNRALPSIHFLSNAPPHNQHRQTREDEPHPQQEERRDTTSARRGFDRRAGRQQRRRLLGSRGVLLHSWGRRLRGR